MNPRFQTGFPGRCRAGEPLMSSRFARCVAILAAVCAVNAASGSGNVIDYTYDAAGNITNIARQGAATLSITGFSPTSGPEGTAVTIYGSAFSTTPANNTVTFNGTAATVTASDSGSIATTVPTGATTGPISVTVGGNTVTSSASFTVTAAGAPTITSFTPTSGASGVSVSVTGTNFSTTSTTVALNGVTASSSVGSTTALTFTVPSAVSSGRITATTSLGTGTSGTDFIVPPPGLGVGDIGTSIRIAANAGFQNVNLATAGKTALVLFDGAANGYYSLQFGSFTTSPTSATVSYAVLKPDNTTLVSGSLSMSSVPTIHLPKVPTSGTYTLKLTPSGLATLNTNVRLDTNATIVVDGAAVPVVQSMPNQSTRFIFAATAGQRIGAGATGTTLTPTTVSNLPLNVQRPDGSNLTSVTCSKASSGNTAANCGVQFVANVTGTYTLTVDSQSSSYASTSVQLSSPATGTLSADVGQAVTLTRVGQGAARTFSANSGDSLALDVSAGTLTPQQVPITLTVLKPDGSVLAYCSPQTPPAPLYCELGTLATAGTYTVTASTYYGMPGTFTLTLKQGPALSATDPPTAFASTNTSESVRARYVATANQAFSVGISSFAYVGSGGNSNLIVYSPTGSQAASTTCNPASASGTCMVFIKKAVAGTYSIAVQPAAGVKISGNVQASAAFTGALTAGTPMLLSATRTGQGAVLTFSGNAGDSTSIKLFSVATTPANQGVTIEIDRPDTSYVAGTTATTTSPVIVNIMSLPVTGTYSVIVTQNPGYPWSGTVELDPGTLLTPNGSPASVANTAAGEPLRYRFTATAGQEVDLGLTGLAYGAGSGSSVVTLTAPSGYSLATFNCSNAGAGNCDYPFLNLSAGSYALVVAPPYSVLLTGGSLQLSTPATGSFVVGNPAQVVAVTLPGQVARYTFSGTAGQLLHLNWSSTSVSGGSSVAVSVLNPSGGTVSSSSFTDGATGGFDIASLPSTGTYTVLFDPAAAATMSASVSLVTR